MKPSELNEIHQSSDSWILGVIYFARRDPRLLVRKRIGALGWTLNFARPLAVPFLLMTVAMLWAGLSGLASSDLSDSMKWTGVIGLLTAMIVLWSWAANSRRYID